MNKLDIFSRILEGTILTTRNGQTAYVNNDVDANSLRTDQNVKQAVTTQGKKLKEDEELDEMARIPSKYKLADDWRAKLAELPEKVQRNKTIQFILNYAGEGNDWQILDIAKAYGESKGDPKFGRQQMFNPLVKDILEPAGVIVATSGDALTKPRKSFAGEEDSVERDLEDRDSAGDRDLAQYFDVAKGKDKDEFDEPEAEEPEPELSKSSYKAPSSSATRAAEFFYDNDRLLQKMINVMMDSRNKPHRSLSENDLRDDSFYNAEKNRVINSKSKIDILIDEYVAKIKEEDPEVQQQIIDMLERKLPNMLNLYNKIVKAVGAIQSKSSFSNQDDEFEDIDINDLEFDEEDRIDEWFIRKFQQRAGIIK